jgi:hypothetical protein
MNALTPIAGRLAKLLRMLSSNKEGEVFAAAQALCRTLQSAGTDIHALAAIVEHGGELNQVEMKKLYDAGHEAGYHKGVQAAENKLHGSDDFRNIDGLPSWHEMALWCQRRSGQLRGNEPKFVADMAAYTVWREPSEKQAKWLKSIYYKLGGKR